jgi:hypothetical protein
MRSTLRKSEVVGRGEEQPQVFQPRHLRRLEVVDDYIRNFLTRNGMTKTLGAFQVQMWVCRGSGTSA